MVTSEQRGRAEDLLNDYCLVRFDAARDAGLIPIEADRFARGDVPMQTLRKLKRDGCPTRIIAKIVT